MIRTKNVSFSYLKAKFAIQNASLCIEKGETVGIIGDNGSGKTTLLLMLAGLLEPREGEIFFMEKPLKSVKDYRKRVAILFQDPEDQLFNTTVFNELNFTLSQIKKGYNNKFIYEYAKEFGIEDLLDKSPFGLSYGEKKMVVFAAITMYDPEILMLDEPFAGLGHRYRSIIFKYIEKAKREGKTIIIATHNPVSIINIVDKIIMLDSGKIVFSGDINQLDNNAKILSSLCQEYRTLELLCRKLD